jgi:hypothetical protein
VDFEFVEEVSFLMHFFLILILFDVLLLFNWYTPPTYRCFAP